VTDEPRRYASWWLDFNRPWRCSLREAHIPAARREASGLVEHEKERRRAGTMFASGPTACVTAGRGLRRGLDGPTKPKQPIKPGTRICPNRQAATSQGRCGTLPGEVKEGICPQGKGGTRARKSPAPTPAQTKPARKHLPADPAYQRGRVRSPLRRPEKSDDLMPRRARRTDVLLISRQR